MANDPISRKKKRIFKKKKKQTLKRYQNKKMGGQIINWHNSLFKNISSRIKNSLLNHQKRLYYSLKNNQITKPFETVLGISFVNKMSFTPIPPPELEFIAMGSYNSVYKTPDSKYAYRISREPITADSEEAHELILEMLLTIRLSKLGISPKVIDAFFVKNELISGENTHAIMITHFSEYGSLSDFFDSPECTFKIIPHLVSQSLKLYRKIIKNDVYCIDVKPPNMLVTESYKIYLIDFGEDFCSSKESGIYNKDYIYKYAKNLCKLWKPVCNSEQILKKGFFGLNILQVGLYSIRDFTINNTEKSSEYARQLVSNISFTKEDIGNIILCSYIPISNEWNGYLLLKHYLLPNEEKYLHGNPISDDPVTVVIASYLLCTLGIKDCIQILRTMSDGDDILRVADNKDYLVWPPQQKAAPSALPAPHVDELESDTYASHAVKAKRSNAIRRLPAPHTTPPHPPASILEEKQEAELPPKLAKLAEKLDRNEKRRENNRSGPKLGNVMTPPPLPPRPVVTPPARRAQMVPPPLPPRKRINN
ncbi:MAG: hypothetical protein CMD75_04810 [Gammaproteobacteria bacterium]|nr:hypothetical protein [Gammaproteobacteria bacterium]|tara:strand:+ start:71 stop:1678 length:1608 start_codon:yes stop_codon:yes gene_type:complete